MHCDDGTAAAVVEEERVNFGVKTGILFLTQKGKLTSSRNSLTSLSLHCLLSTFSLQFKGGWIGVKLPNKLCSNCNCEQLPLQAARASGDGPGV